MTHMNAEEIGAKVLLRGVHLSLTEAMKASILEKASRLFRHEPHIIRVRIDVEQDHTRANDLFVAKGHIEIGGPDLLASVSTEDAYKSVDLLIDKLDRLLRKRSTARTSKRHNGSLTEFAADGIIA